MDYTKTKDEAFNSFYRAYPHKINGKAAFIAWKKLRPDRGLMQEILAAVEDQATWDPDCGAGIHPDREARLHPATWLNNTRWTDVKPASKPKQYKTPGGTSYDPNKVFPVKGYIEPEED